MCFPPPSTINREEAPQACLQADLTKTLSQLRFLSSELTKLARETPSSESPPGITAAIEIPSGVSAGFTACRSKCLPLPGFLALSTALSSAWICKSVTLAHLTDQKNHEVSLFLYHISLINCSLSHQTHLSILYTCSCLLL